MKEEFEMSMMGELNFFLDLQIKQTSAGIFISQAKYIKELLKKFEMEKCKPISTPMGSDTSLSKDPEEGAVDLKQYRGMIGSLLYLTASRPDIHYSVCYCARFQSSPKESHLKAVKRILRYLAGTPEVGLWYPSNGDFSLKGFTDADYGRDSLERKSTSGGCHFLGDCLISWYSKKEDFSGSINNRS